MICWLVAFDPFEESPALLIKGPPFAILFPMRLCNVLVKKISLIWANRLREMLDELVGPHQSAFIKGRNISENILLAHERSRNCFVSAAGAFVFLFFEYYPPLFLLLALL